VRELIARRFAKRLGPAAVQLHLRRWGLTPQKPLVRAERRQPAAIAAWLATSHPAIAKRAKAVRAAICWGDETGASNQDQIGRSYPCARGPDPDGSTDGGADRAQHDQRIARSMISAVSNRGLMRFMLHEGASNADRFLAFLRRLTKDAGRKAVLIVDNLKVHKAGKVQAWVKSHAHEIELFHLPPYAPDHNPSEYLGNGLKQQLRQPPQSGSEQEPVGRTRSVLRAVQRSPERARAYFRPEPVRYAA
jgi:transposase